MWRALARLLERVYRLCEWGACALLVVLAMLVLYSIVARIIGTYGGGASDVAGYVMAAASFLALAPTFKANGHIYVKTIVSQLPLRGQLYVSAIAHVAMLGAAASIAAYMSRLAYYSYQFGERSEGADAIPLWIPQLPVAVGAVFFTVAVLHGLVESIAKIKRGH